MKLKIALAVSLLLHGLLFMLVLYQPVPARSGEMTYYVDLIHLGGAGNGRPRSAGTETAGTVLQETAASMKALTVEKKTPATLHYPSADVRRRYDEEKKMVAVVRKPLPGRAAEPQPVPAGENGLSTGISGGDETGNGGSGGGDGWSGSFPYAYYVEIMRNRISASWYSALVAPGLRGRHLTTVYFIIQRTGRITDLKIEKPSGVDSLDLSSLRAVSEAAPFAPLPGDFSAGYLVVHFEFVWEKK